MIEPLYDTLAAGAEITQEPKMDITEQDMREYFERIVGKFTGLNEQARKVEELTQRVAQMEQRINSLETENYHLKQDLSTANSVGEQARQDREAIALELNNAREHAHALSQTIINRDSRVTDLERQVNDANNSVAQMDHELGVAHNRVSDLEALVSDIRGQLDQVIQERDRWVSVSQQYENELNSLKRDFERLRSILNPPHIVTAEVA